ncbi:MAG: hypothetical protein KA104_02105 [Candidatus Pacebacteria bacterium]|nr:hypothetical protein [Candidatus Paceibacterota bacterium]
MEKQVGRALTFYQFLVTIPDRIYPFAEEIEGQRVRFRRAYDQALARIQEKRGYGSYGAWLITYRGVCHVVGAILFIGFSTFLSKQLFGSDVALYVLLVLASFALAAQEFLLQPQTHGQMKLHSVVDLMSWVLPFGIYVFMHIH